MTQLPPELLERVEEGLALLLRAHQRLDPLDADDDHQPPRRLQPLHERVQIGPRHDDPCPNCGSSERLRVLETRCAPGGKRRRIQCFACGERFTTWQPDPSPTPSP